MIDLDWRTRAACTEKEVDPDWFFPGDSAAETKRNYEQAAKVCDRCPVFNDCRADLTSFVDGDNEAAPLVGFQAGTTWGDRSGHNASREAYYQANKERMLAKRRARERALRAAESPEERALRLAKRYGKVNA